MLKHAIIYFVAEVMFCNEQFSLRYYKHDYYIRKVTFDEGIITTKVKDAEKDEV